jgi:hypothetical protein
MRFVSRAEVAPYFQGRSVAIVGSGPGVLDNEPGLVDSRDVVVRVNNYKLSPAAGQRTDVYFSYFGNAIKKTAAELQRDGVDLCMCKCPNHNAIRSEWHKQRGKLAGVDFRWIYTLRKPWWFTDTYVPELGEFLEHFHLLGGRVPTTGFSAILTVLSFEPASLFLTGFDFFSSGVHNVDEKWKPGEADDPIGHAPDRELALLRGLELAYPITTDRRLRAVLHP